MATYLLRADDADMARWKAEAKIRALPFSEFIRKSLDRATSSQARVAAVEAASSTGVGTSLSEAASTGGTLVDPGTDRPPVPVQAVSSVDLREQGRELAGRMSR